MVEIIYFEIDGTPIEAKIYHEQRYDARASIGRRAVTLRLPLFLSKAQKVERIEDFKKWVTLQFEERGDKIRPRISGKKYEHGSSFVVGSRQYLINIEFEDKKSHSAKLLNGILYFSMSKEDTPTHLQKSMRHLASRLIAQDFLPEIKRRVLELNQIHFQKGIKSVNLKLNQSNWGSCSASGNLNFSTRLLFAPEDVIDYVIIHELAHLIEMNHSDRFWKLIADAMPDYIEKEKWLKLNGHEYQF